MKTNSKVIVFSLCLSHRSKSNSGAIAVTLHRLVRHLLGIQHEGAKPLLLGGDVQLVDVMEQRFHFLVQHEGQDCRVQGRPGVGAVVRLPVVAAAALYLIPEGEPADFVLVQNFHHLVVEGLV